MCELSYEAKIFSMVACVHRFRVLEVGRIYFERSNYFQEVKSSSGNEENNLSKVC